VDSGYNIISMPHPAALKTVDDAQTAAEENPLNATS
jgi:enoyl-[acyl-carrier protein] reductase I